METKGLDASLAFFFFLRVLLEEVTESDPEKNSKLGSCSLVVSSCNKTLALADRVMLCSWKKREKKSGSLTRI